MIERQRGNMKKKNPTGTKPGTPGTTGAPSSGGLPLMFPIINSSVAAYVSTIARTGDLVCALNAPPSNVGQGTAGVYWKSAAEIIANTPSVSGKVSIVGYDAEHWVATPSSEQSNLASAVASAAATVHAHGMKMMLIPDSRFSDQEAAAIAVGVDYYIIQAQHYEKDPTGYASYVQGVVSKIKSASSARVFAQVTFALGTVAQAIAAAQAVGGIVDGVSVWMGSDVTSLTAFIKGYRG